MFGRKIISVVNLHDTNTFNIRFSYIHYCYFSLPKDLLYALWIPKLCYLYLLH